MKKILIVGILGLLVLAGFNTTAITFSQTESHKIEESLDLRVIDVKQEDRYSSVSLQGSDGFIHTPGQYSLPFLTKSYVVPFGSRVKEINILFEEEYKIFINKPLRKAVTPEVDDRAYVHEIPEYAFPNSGNNEVFTREKFQYSIVSGRFDDNLGIGIILRIYPVTYDHSMNQLSGYTKINIEINYELYDSPTISNGTYDLLIIAPEKFLSEVEPLAVHKEAYGIQTKIVTLTEIYQSTFFPVQGRDCAEEIKYFIKSALDEWGITYVLLVGGRQGGILEETWWVPVRYSHADDGGEASYLTDLYFADIYDASMNFSSWDSNENDVFAEWIFGTKDILDMFPEVYIGRLACRNTNEVKTMVNKIIDYETNAFGSDWSNIFVGVAGDTYPNQGDPYYEGELATQGSFNHLSGYTSSYLWTSTETFADKQDVINELNKGCGFVHFSGHGNPAVWGNHPPNSKKFIYGPNNFEVGFLRNKGENPIITVGGCHNAQFNVSLLNIIKGILTEGLEYFSRSNPLGSFWYDEWIPRCWGWSLINKKGGGGIALMANTGLGYGASGSNWNQSRGRVMEMLFYEKYSEGYDMLGATHGQEIMEFMTLFPPMDDLIDCKIAQQWVLLGDPSLKIGGYSS